MGKERVKTVRRVGLVVVMMVVALVVGSGVALAAVKYGTDGQDFLMGTNDDDVLYGKGGIDFIDGRGGNDVLYGGDGADEVVSFPGDDVLFGGGGNDFVMEGKGNNTLYGGGGNDFFQATAINPDRPGSEDTTPKKKDLVFCGSGRDTVVVDPGRIDVVASDCEKVYVRTGQGDTLVRR
jgi:Ca2+-binding RTX toxin-like protein